MLMWQSRRSCLISKSSLPLWKIFCKKTNRSSCLQSVRPPQKNYHWNSWLPWETVTSSGRVSSGSVKSAWSCCPLLQWRHLPHNETYDLVMTPYRSWSSPSCFSLSFCDALNIHTKIRTCIRGLPTGIYYLMKRSLTCAPAELDWYQY